MAYASAPRARAPRGLGARARGLGIITERRYGYFPPQPDQFTRFSTGGTLYLVLGPMAPRFMYAGQEPLISARASGAKGWLSGTWDTDGLTNPSTGQLNDSFGQMVASGWQAEDLSAIAAQLAPAANISDPGVLAAVIGEIGQTLQEGGAIGYSSTGAPVLQYAQGTITEAPPASSGIFVCSELGEDAQMAQERYAKLMQYGVTPNPTRCDRSQFELWVSIVRKEVSEGGYRVASNISPGTVYAFVGGPVIDVTGGTYTGSAAGEEAWIPKGGTFYEPTGERIEWDESTSSVRRTKVAEGTDDAGELVSLSSSSRLWPWLLAGGLIFATTRRKRGHK